MRSLANALHGIGLLVRLVIRERVRMLFTRVRDDLLESPLRILNQSLVVVLYVKLIGTKCFRFANIQWLQVKSLLSWVNLT